MEVLSFSFAVLPCLRQTLNDLAFLVGQFLPCPRGSVAAFASAVAHFSSPSGADPVARM